MTIAVNNWIVIFAPVDKEIIKQEYEKLGLKEFTASIVLITDDISTEEEKEYLDFIKNNLKYSGHINSSKIGNLGKTLECMGAVSGDRMYALKKNKFVRKRANLKLKKAGCVIGKR